MVDHAAHCILAAGIRARVSTLVAVAVLGVGAVRVRHALGPAGDPRIAEVLWEALAVCLSVVVVSALGVCGAW